jgi:hypothetical protein
MNRQVLYTLEIIVLAMLAFATSPASAQTTSNGPYYATPSWDQKFQCDTPATCPRFIVLSNWNSEAVLDRETGLVWERSPDNTGGPNNDGRRDWSDAQIHCNFLTTGNRVGWRLPTLQELSSLADPTQSNPSLPPGHPFGNVQSSDYWSATTRANDTTRAWGVSFGSIFVGGPGGLPTVNGVGGILFVWCVRGGQGVDAQ